jgi:hypothetical protein
MGSQQSKDKKKFKRFWKKFLAAVVEINSRRDEGFAIEIELANGVSIGLTLGILLQNFPGCTYFTQYTGRNFFIWTKERLCANGKICEFHSLELPNHTCRTFWKWNLEKVRDFYNGVIWI